MTMFVIADLAVTAIWAIREPKSPEDLTMDEMVDLIVLG
jgi:hypothetical protein